MKKYLFIAFVVLAVVLFGGKASQQIGTKKVATIPGLSIIGGGSIPSNATITPNNVPAAGINRDLASGALKIIYPQQTASSPAAASSYSAPGGTTGYADTSSAPAGPSYTIGVNDPSTLALYQQQIAQYNQALQGLPTQLQGSQNQIQSAYQTALNQLLGAKNAATSSYDTSTTGNKQSYVTNKNTIGTNAGQSLNGLERLLGSRGAGGSSAALFSAPQAVAQQATAERSGAGQTYGANQAALDTTYNNYLTGNQNDRNSIASQRDQNLNSAQAQEQQQQAQLNQQLATLQAQYAAAQGSNPTAAAAPYLASAQNLLSSAGKLGLNTFTPQYNTTAYAAPTASSYTANPFATPTTTNPSQGIASNYVSPALSSLLKPKLSGVSAA